MKILEGENKDEFIVSRHGQFQRAINVINNYDETESRTENIEIEERWSRLLKILKDIENRGEEAILIGDQNKLIGNSESGIEKNNPKISFGGKLVLELLSEGNYYLVNSSDKCRGGPFTRVEPNNDEIKSCLDLVIVSKGLVGYIVELVIDKERRFTPHRVVTGKKLIYTDHLSLHLILKGMPILNPAMRATNSEVIWNTNKPEGWKKYKALTETNVGFDSLIEKADKMTANELMNKIENHSTRTKHICFGKVRNSKGLESDKELNDLYKEKMQAMSSEDTQKVDSKIAEKLLGVQRVQYEKKLDYLKELKASKGKSAAIFKLKEKVVGSKKEGMESVSMNDHITGEMIYEPEKLKEASSNYLRNLLTNREPKEGYKEHFSTLRRLHDS